MRIQIETLLIDLNEELFSLSDELAWLYSNTARVENQKLDQEAQKKINDFELRKTALQKKVA